MQDRSISFTLFPQNIYTSSLKLLNNKSRSLGSLLFTSLHLEFSSSSKSHCFLSYSCTLKRNHSIMSEFSLQHKPLTDKLPCLQGLAVLWILTTIAPLPFITVSCFQTLQGANSYTPQWKRNMLFYIHPTVSSCLMLEFLPVRNRNFLWSVFARNWMQLTLVLSFEHLNATSMQMNQYMNKQQQLKCIIYLFTTIQLCNQCSQSIGMHNTQLSKMSSLFLTMHFMFWWAFLVSSNWSEHVLWKHLKLSALWGV